MTRRCAAVILGSLTLLPGCSSPDVKVLSAELIESSDTGSVVAFRLAAGNASEDALPLREVEYSASAGAMGFSGRRAGEATLRAAGSQELVIPASFPGRVSVGDSASINGWLGYVQPGALAAEAFDLGVYRPSVAFNGQVTVQEPTPPAPRIRTTPVLRARPQQPAPSGEAAPK